ncbi:MAG: hypothetical protein FWH21_07055 [Kiritimatiellaeota bacterium]|nr:hypothetical protein [Kiritimatiellota bacterium]
MKTQTKRRIVSLTLLASFVMLFASAVIVHATHGTTASHTWLHLHGLFGVIFTLASIYHIAYNWRTLKSHLFGNSK